LKKFAKRVVFSKSYKTFHHHNRSFYRIDWKCVSILKLMCWIWICNKN
jgi:hypothetical protein